MILDFTQNWKHYAKGNIQVWQKAFDFIHTAGTDMEEKKYTIDGDHVFAFVQGYNTLPEVEGKIEMHRDYLDIHAVWSGVEQVYYSPVQELDLVKDYTPQSDDLLYDFKKDIATGFRLCAGKFALFFPGEGHLTRIQACGDATRVKKVVVKIHRSLFY